MSSIFLLLQQVHEKVHDSAMKLNYSEPKIFTGGVNINTWSKLSNTDRKHALSKNWYVYYSYRNPKTGRLKRQINIKAGANYYKDKKSRYHILSKLKESLEYVLSKGFNPYGDNSSLAEFIEQLLSSDEKKINKTKTIAEKRTFIEETEPIAIVYPIKKAFNLAFQIKSKVQSENSHANFRSRINRFIKWLQKESIDLEGDISIINKKLVIQYLNTVLQTTSSRNRNNTRTDISSLFQTLEDNEIIYDNFIKKINVLKAIPERNKTYTSTQEKEIFAYLKEHDTILYLFVQFVSYNYLRPIEVCRLKIGDLDLKDKRLYVRAKNKPVKIKIIPDILIDQLPNISNLDKDHFLFTPDKFGGEWETKENNKRDFFYQTIQKNKRSLWFR